MTEIALFVESMPCTHYLESSNTKSGPKPIFMLKGRTLIVPDFCMCCLCFIMCHALCIFSCLIPEKVSDSYEYGVTV